MRSWPNHFPFGFKIALSAALLSAAALITFIIASSAIVFDNMLEGADFELKQIAIEELKRYAEIPPTSEQLAKFEDSAPLDAEMADVVLRYYTNGSMTWQTANPVWHYEGLGEGATSRRAKKQTVWDGVDPWRSFTFTDQSGQVIVLSMDLYEVKREVLRMIRTYLKALPFAVLIVGVGAWLMSKRAASPLQTLAAAMEHVAQGDLRERIDLAGTRDALDRLAEVFNRMTERLESSFEQATRFTSDASHELRTPLTVLRGNLENALQKADGAEAMQLADLLEQTERLRAIVDGLLLLSRSDAGRLGIKDDEVDLSQLAREAADDFADSIEAAGIRFEQAIESDIHVRGDQQLLRQVVGNLLGNAEKFNLPDDGRIELRLHANGDELAQLEVLSTGELIPKEDYKRVFRRFFRASSDRETPKAPGSGLGLSIVQAAVEAHGGHARCDTVDDANRFVVELPMDYSTERITANQSSSDSAGGEPSLTAPPP
ncbi:MAG: HAMP domain-containing sensor histidine kinase [Verrucomicrobiota bacterium]